MMLEITLLGIICVLICLLVLYERLLRKQMIDKMSSRYIFITGCDSGFGQSLAKRLDQLGCHVIAGCLTPKGVADVKDMTSDRCRTVIVDVSNSESVKEACETVKRIIPENEGLWGVVNNAGVSTSGLVRWLRKKDYEFCINVNLYGTIDVTTTFLQLVQKAGGRVVNMSSMVGLFPVLGSTPYAVSKCAVEGFSDILRRETSNINVCIVEPGTFKTPITTPESIANGLLRAWERAPLDIKEEDRDFANKMTDVVKARMEKGACEDTHLVVDAYVHALLSRHPRKRYVVGRDANLFRLLGILPTTLADYLFNLMK